MAIERDVLRALRRLMRAADLGAKKLATQTGLTTSQLLVLERLASESELTVSALAERVGLAQATVTVIVDRLEGREIVARRRGETDRRQVKVSLTETGRALLDSAPTPLQNRFLENFAALSEWEKHAILASLHRLADLMEAEGIDASPVLGSIDRRPSS